MEETLGWIGFAGGPPELQSRKAAAGVQVQASAPAACCRDGLPGPDPTGRSPEGTPKARGDQRGVQYSSPCSSPPEIRSPAPRTSSTHLHIQLAPAAQYKVPWLLQNL
ncbi:hypothetical protein Y1Q_0016322 [Alligator mississippiensis]|uniref:Uncharacterized protein n=1 Tax=Alligator mississippiensis TaxID=8496 RepID=A0A151N2D3_ALLMI|nr:hypothetical protein Y1Q_0016322 [Alligator mississippiensis]